MYDPRPKNCPEESTEQCVKRFREKISAGFKQCQIKARKLKDRCKRFRASVGCWSEQSRNGRNAKFVCGRQVHYPLPMFREPPECHNGPPMTIMPVPGIGSDIYCTSLAKKAHSKSIKKCLNKLTYMKFDQCGLLKYENSCYLNAIPKQFKPSK